MFSRVSVSCRSASVEGSEPTSSRAGMTIEYNESGAEAAGADVMENQSMKQPQMDADERRSIMNREGREDSRRRGWCDVTFISMRGASGCHACGLVVAFESAFIRVHLGFTSPRRRQVEPIGVCLG